MLEFCACIGPEYGEPYCYCEMMRRGLPLNEADRKVAMDRLNSELKRVFGENFESKPIKHKTAD